MNTLYKHMNDAPYLIKILLL